MRVLEVIINDTTIDVESRTDFPLLLKKQILSFGQVDSRGDVTSFTVKFPSTGKNLRALNLNLNLDNYGKFYNTENYETTILVNSIELMRGIFVLTSFNDFYIEGYIQSTAIGQSRLIGNKKLNELNFPTIPFLGMETIIENQSDQTTNPINHSQNSIICFPPVSYGTYFIPYKQTSGHTIDVTEQPLASQLSITPYDTGGLSYSDIPPCIYVRAIMRQIFNDIGYTLSGSQINSSDLDNLIIPYTANNLVNYNQNTIGGYTATINATNRIILPVDMEVFNIDGEIIGSQPAPATQHYCNIETKINGTTNGYFTYSDNYSLSHIFTNRQIYQNTVDININYGTSTQFSPTDNIKYNLFGNLTINVNRAGIYPSNDERGTDVKIAFVKTNGSDFEVLQNNQNIQITDPNLVVFEFDIPQDTGVITQTYNIPINVDFTPQKGEAYRFIVLTRTDTLLRGYLEFDSTQTNTYTIKAIDSVDDFTLQTVNGLSNIDNISQLEFVKSMISLYNLFFYVDENNKKISFETWSNFYNPKQFAYELKGKKTIIEPALKDEFIEYTYTNDDNDFLTNGDTDYNFIKSNNIRYKGTSKEINVIFSKTELQQYNLIKNIKSASTAPDYFVKLQNPIFNNVGTIFIPQISSEDKYESPQSDFFSEKETITVSGPQNIDVWSEINQAYKVQSLKYNIRLLRLTTPYDFTNVGMMKLKNQDSLNNKPTITYQQTISQANNENLTQEYFYDNYWFNTIQEYERSELVTFEVYIDYTDYIQLQSNRLILIDGIFYRLIEFAPFNPLNPKPIILKLLKVF